MLPKDGRFDVAVKLADGSIYSATGKLDFSDVRVNPQTGTSEARAVLPNPSQAATGSVRARHAEGRDRFRAPSPFRSVRCWKDRRASS